MSTEQQEKIVYPDTVTITDKYVEIRSPEDKFHVDKKILDEVYTETIWTLFERNAKAHPQRDFLGVRNYDKEKKCFEDHFTFIKYEKGFEIIEKAAYGFNELGIKPGDIVNECCKNRPEWIMAELAAFRQAAAVSPLRNELDNTYYEPIVLENKATFAVINPEKVDDYITLCENIRAHGHELTYKAIIVFPHVQGPKFGDESLTNDQIERAKKAGVVMMKWESFLEIGKPCPPAEQKPSNLHSIIYTSGTTAQYPKGVLLPQQAFVCERSRQGHIIFADEIMYYSYIPMAHISERATTAVFLGYGGTMGFPSGDITTLLDDFEIIKPTQFGSVPLMLKSIYLKAQAAIRATGNKELVNSIFRKKLGDGSCFFCMTFGGPVTNDITEWITKDIGMVYTNKYGSTEMAGSTIMTPKSGEIPPPGCIGFPNMLVTVRIVDIPELGYSVKNNPPSGELIFKYPGMPICYLNNPEKTKELIDEDGWLHSNDVGQLNPDGSITLIDRKDNLLRTSNGTYVPVEKIESIISLSPIIGRMWVYCEDIDNFIISVVVPDFNILAMKIEDESLKQKCLEIAKNPECEGAKEFCKNETVKKIVLDELQAQTEKNRFPFYWNFRGVIIESVPWSELNGCMTFTSKLKRKALLAKYKDQIQELLTEIRKDFRVVYH